MRASIITAFAVYLLLFFGITLADLWSTNISIDSGAARELNTALADGDGRLSGAFLGLNGVLGLIAAVFFALGFGRLRDVPSEMIANSRDSLVRFSSRSQTEAGYQYVYFTLVVLIMKLTAVVSNLMVPLGAMTLPKLIFVATGRVLPEPLLLIVTIGVSIPIGMVLMFPVAKALARWQSDQ